MAEPYFTRRIEAVRKAISGSADLVAAQAALIELAAKWTPDALALTLGDAMELSSWQGREAVFGDEGDVPAFAFDPIRQAFQEQIDFLRQKRAKPTKSGLDALQGVHDRAFVVAGVTDTAMLEEFQAALIKAAEQGLSVDDFAKDFDRLVEKYGWEYKGERNWRIRTIFETNMRTSFMAGRLKQMRDPDVVKLRPYWQYLHGERRTPKVPRPQHLIWNKFVLMWDDPWWNTHFPPNDWLCSCGVRTLSKRDLERLGKSGPDKTPPDAKAAVMVRGVGLVNQPVGIGFGWDHMPGDLWERGLVPSSLMKHPLAIMREDLKGQHLVSIDQASPMSELLAAAKPFKAKVMAAGLPIEDYVAEFLKPFGANLGAAGLWTDKTGARLVISDQMFRDGRGDWKGTKRGHGEYAALLAEAVTDPDEIWMGLRNLPDEAHPGYQDPMITRRYIRVDPATSLFAMFEVGPKNWLAITGYAAFNRAKPDYNHIDKQRVGKLIWKRK